MSDEQSALELLVAQLDAAAQMISRLTAENRALRAMGRTERVGAYGEGVSTLIDPRGILPPLCYPHDERTLDLGQVLAREFYTATGQKEPDSADRSP